MRKKKQTRAASPGSAAPAPDDRLISRRDLLRGGLAGLAGLVLADQLGG